MIKIYTDGSCHTQRLTGAWVAIVLFADQKIILKGVEEGTTHHRMEIMAVIKALEYVENKLDFSAIEVVSDSQYVVQLPLRKNKLQNSGYKTKAGKPTQNADLVQLFFEKIALLPVTFVKVKAHLQGGDPLNREADLLVRNLLRSQ